MIHELAINHIFNDKSKLGTTSFCGAELLFSTIAFKLALRDISKLAKPNFFAIDEGLSSMDSVNVSNLLKPIAELLESRNKFVLVIDHNEIIKTIGQDEIVVVKGKYGFADVFNMNYNSKEMVRQMIDNDLVEMSIDSSVKVDTAYSDAEDNNEETVEVKNKKQVKKNKKQWIKIAT